MGDTRVFATVGDPGMPEGILVDEDEGVVYVSTHVSVRGNSGGPPSKIFRYDLATGSLLGEIVVEGQNLAGTHGVLAMAMDDAGRLYVVDRNPGRVLRFDLSGPAPVQETYATVPDLPACSAAPPPCSPTTMDQATFADYITFDAAGNMYVTDLEAATIFRVANDGPLPRMADAWVQDARFDAIFGLNGIAIGPDGRVTFAMTGSQQPGTPTQGVIYSLPPVDDPSPADLEVVHTYLEPATGPDGIAFGASGNLYVALTGHSQISILAPEGEEILRFPDVVTNQLQPVPYDLPASVAFDGAGSLLVTNQSFFAAEPSHWVVFDAWVDDTAFGLQEPTIIP
jgi:sugar lactone lactonase YvrE